MKTKRKRKIPRKGRAKKRNLKHLNTDEPEDLKNAPHSFVFHRGVVGEHVLELIKNFRKVMEPFTASELKAKRANKLKDFLSIAGVLHVSHMCIFSATGTGTHLKVARAPRGPTLYFRVLNYSLSKDVISKLKRQLVFQRQFINPPLIVMNNFSGEGVHFKLMSSMFQNMFPTINLTKIDLNTVRRCVLLNYNPETEEIDFRHYSIKVVPVNISKGVKKMVQNKVPNLSRFDDAADFILRANVLSESEGEDDPGSHVTLPQKIWSRGNVPMNQSSIRLVELGPRMTLQLIKIEEGFLSGEVLYHKIIVKSEEEKRDILERRLEKRRLKEARKREQEMRKKKKEMLKKMEREKAEQEKAKPVAEEDVDDLADAEWYKAEVGADPEEGLFQPEEKTGIKRKKSFKETGKRKKFKMDDKKTSGKVAKQSHKFKRMKAKK
ncbi:UNVERIFIED_CONTAM: hypothetical protein PYX00_003182 [Menopon gallinae]|uniref:Brix domain-containing protein n=1 Tax=Menopon gallinae TaxID=328185 RepID=A0AAW2HZA7_9NEOP